MGLAALQVTVELTEINCGKCGGTYAINERYRQQKYQKGESWTCPYCKTGWGYTGNSENEKLKRELAAEKQRKEAALARENAERQARMEAEAKAERLKKRASAGVCPCCNRTFKQLAAHMATKHPEMVKGAKGKLPKVKKPPMQRHEPLSEFEKAKAKYQAKLARKRGYESG